MSLSADVVIGKYIALRDKRKELKDKYVEEDAPFVAAMEKCEAWLLNQCNTIGVDNLSVKGIGRATKKLDMKASCKDWNAFHQFVLDTNNLDMFERRIARSVLKAYIDDHKGEIPPGVDVIFEQTITVTRANKENQDE